MPRFLFICLFTLIAFSSIAELDALPRNMEQLNQQGLKIDLDKIKGRGYLRVLTRNNPACYFMHRGQLMGFEYELVRLFAKKHDLEVVVIVPENWNEMGKWLEEGRADLIAAAVTMTAKPFDKKHGLEYCHRYGEFNEVIIGRANDSTIQSLDDLNDRTIHVRKSSSYFESLQDLKKKKKLQFKIELVPENEETFEILEKVAQGTYDLTCADQTILNESVRLGEQLNPVIKLPTVRGYSWVARKNQPQLQAAVNAFFKQELGGSDYNTIYNRYFNMARNTALDENFKPTGTGEISPYDNLVKKYAAIYDFPWTLICSQMFQESGFKNDAVSWCGAQGLLQLMPATAKEVGVKDPFDPGQNIRGGTDYLKRQYNRVPDEVDALNTTCFALAAYNGGYGHLIDARNLAEQKGKNPNIWTDNVDYAYALLSESRYAKRAKYGYCRSGEIISYVRKIMSRYVAYDEFMNPGSLK
ncbi:transporter substrate-binding domain-containing protein [Pontiellaceae bacterium B1224]|nr:transporter substrate-binding domain-containing protein [Pontiellaceae bacterium B1224]